MEKKATKRYQLLLRIGFNLNEKCFKRHYFDVTVTLTNELQHDKTNKMTCVSSKDSELGHPPSLIRVFTVRMKKPLGLGYPLSAQRRL